MKAILKLENLCCANCAAKIEDQVQRIDGVESAGLSFMTQKLSIEAAEDDIEDIVREVSRIVKKIESDVTIVRIK
ncbi:cation transporter [Candidatus Methanoprimaticola sp. MG2]|uniref:cation transporter n=1 Tax=Candidatus Methanoprimaticola sp. MG2 TaxID=3228838 RepID=UPI0039C71B1F